MAKCLLMKSFQEISKQSKTNGTNEIQNHYTVNTKMTDLNNEESDEIVGKKTKIGKEIQEISKNLEQILEHINSEKNEEDMKKRWQFAALVLDRFCFVISLIFLIIITIATIFVHRNFWQN